MLQMDGSTWIAPEDLAYCTVSARTLRGVIHKARKTLSRREERAALELKAVKERKATTERVKVEF